MADARHARWRATLHRLERVRRAGRLCHAIMTHKTEKVYRLISGEEEPEVFTTEIDECEYPLSVAAQFNPKLAQRMLDRGADPRKAPQGGGSLLYDVIEDEPWENAEALGLFVRLLAGGADPEEFIVQRTSLTPSPYAVSLLAVILSAGAGAAPYLEALLADPRFEGVVWSMWGTCPRLTAAAYAGRTGADWARGPVAAWERWSPARRAWISAVARAQVRRG